MVSAMKRLIAACSATIEANEPRRSRRRVRREKKVSTALSHEHAVGVKWNTKRGCRASQARTLACLWGR